MSKPVLRSVLGLVFFVGALSNALAQQAGGPVISISASDQSVKEIAASLSTTASVPVITDAAATKKYSGSFNSTPLDQILDSVAKTTETMWVKVYIPTATTKPDELKTAKEQIALLDQLKAAKTTMIYDPATKSQIILTKSAPDPAADEADAKALGLRAVYVLYLPAPPPAPKTEAPVAVSYTDLQKQQQDQFLNMTPDQRAKAMEDSFAAELAMDPTTRSQYQEARMQAMQALRESNSPVFQQWRDSMRQSGRGRGGPGGGGFGGGQDGGGRGQRQQQQDQSTQQ